MGVWIWTFWIEGGGGVLLIGIERKSGLRMEGWGWDGDGDGCSLGVKIRSEIREGERKEGVFSVVDGVVGGREGSFGFAEDLNARVSIGWGFDVI